MLALAIASLAAALAIMRLPHLSNASSARLSRLVVPVATEPSGAASQTRLLAKFGDVLRAIDPTFRASEPMLRSLGVSSLENLIAIEAGKIASSLLISWLSERLVGTVTSYIIIKIAVPVLVFVGVIALIDRLIKSVSLSRRRVIRRELVLGIEVFCIFLEGGQSLDQTFRSFCEICRQALPRLAAIQAILVSDLDNGMAYDKAIARWADNLGVEEARPLAALLADSLVHGTELVPHLRQFSADLVEQRIVAARASIGVKSSQLTVVMVLFFLPAILAFVISPAISAVAAALSMH